jgi:hypothetical protein
VALNWKKDGGSQAVEISEMAGANTQSNKKSIASTQGAP